jgi:hypothetical protein
MEGSESQGGRGFRLRSRKHGPLQAEAPRQTAASGMAKGIIDALFQRPQGSNAPQAVTAGWTRDIAEELLLDAYTSSKPRRP